jgi:hypothetical protein
MVALRLFITIIVISCLFVSIICICTTVFKVCKCGNNVVFIFHIFSYFHCYFFSLSLNQ